MVTGLQLPLKDFLPAESAAAKSHSRDSETVEGLTFGGILRAKEKQLQDAQTVSAASIAAAVAVLQARPVAKFVNDTIASQTLTETQPVESESGEKTQAELPEIRPDRPEQASSILPWASSSPIIPAAEQSLAENMRIESKSNPSRPTPVIPANETLQPAEAPSVSPEKLTDRKPGKVAGQSFSGEEVPAFGATQPERQVTPEKVGIRSKAAAAFSEPIRTRPDKPAAAAQFPQVAMEAGDGAAALPEANVGNGHPVKARPAFTLAVGPELKHERSLLHKQPVTKPARVETDQTIKAGKQVLPMQFSEPESQAEGQQDSKETPVAVDKQSAGRAGAANGNGGTHATVKPESSVAGDRKARVESLQVAEQTGTAVEALQFKTARIEIEAPASEAFSTDSGKVRPGMPMFALAEEPALSQTQPNPEIQSTFLGRTDYAGGNAEVSRSATSHVETGAVQGATEGASKLRFAQSTLPNRMAVSGGESAQIGYVHAVEANLKQNGHSVTSGNHVAKFEPVPANFESTAEPASDSPATAPFARGEAARPVATSYETVNSQPQQAGVASNAIEPANEKNHQAEKQPETRPGIEATVGPAPQARGNLIESVAGTRSGVEPKFPAAEVIQQIVHHIETRVHNRSTEMHLQLNPKELGFIDVQMVSGPQGLSLTFSAEQPATGRLLETQLSQLHQSLTEAGVQVSGLNIGQHGQPRQEGGFLNHNQPFIQASQRGESPTNVNVPETRRPVRGTGRPGEVDYLI